MNQTNHKLVSKDGEELNGFSEIGSFVLDTFDASEMQICRQCGEEFLPYVCTDCPDKPEISDVCHSCHWHEIHSLDDDSAEHICRICGSNFLPRKCVVPECGKQLTDVCPLCHEELVHDGMRATVWTLPDCEKCHTVVESLKSRGRTVALRNLENLSSGKETDLDAMVCLALAGGIAPLVFMDGRFLDSGEVEVLTTEERV